MNKIFQTVLLIVFGFIVVVAVIVFAMGSSGGGQVANIGGPVTVWGTFPQRQMELLFTELRDQNSQFDITYIEHNAKNLENDFVEALASGRGPDLVILPHTLLVSQADRLVPIGYNFVSERQFDDAFVDAASIYKNATGFIGFPFVADPLIMYWNKSLFANGNIVAYPKFWNEFLTLAPTLSKKVGNTFTQNLVALGDSGNVLYTKEILSALTMQTGNKIVALSQGNPSVTLDEGDGASSALRFFVEFSNPNKTAYSWNSAEANSRDAFASGKLAIYFGLASDINIIKTLNPNLDFDISPLPQIKDSQYKATYANVYGVSLTRDSKNPEGAFAVAQLLGLGNFAGRTPELLGLPPLRRDVLATKPTDSITPVLFESTIMTKVWLDPNADATNDIFKNMVNQVTVGRLTPEDAISRAQSLLISLFKTQ